MRVLLAVVAEGGVCSLGFVASMVRLQSALMSVAGLAAAVCVVGGVAEAAHVAVREGGFDAVVALSSNLTVPVPLVTQALMAPGKFVCGVYPLPVGLDWARVERGGDDGEDARFRGNAYSIDPAAATVLSDSGYAQVDRALLGAAILHRPAFEAVAAKCPDGAASDEQVCAAWGRPILVDLEHQCAAMGPLEFAGCAARRLPGQNFVSGTEYTGA